MDQPTFTAGEGGIGDSGQRQLLAAYARWSRTYELILHAASEGILSLDPEQRIVFANPAAARMLGWPVEDMMGQPVQQVVFGNVSSPGEARTGEAEYQHRRQVFHTREGKDLVVECSQARIREDDRDVGAVLIFNDISDRERAERELQESLRSLEHMNQRLTQAHHQLLQAEKRAAVGHLAAGVAHEINNPLGYIQGNLGIIAQTLDDLFSLVECFTQHWATAQASKGASLSASQGALDERMGQIDLEFLREDMPLVMAETREGVSRVSKVVRQLLDFSSAGDGEWGWATPEDVCRSATNKATQRRQIFHIDQHYDPLPAIRCLPQRLEQATPPTGMAHIRASCCDGQQVCISIEDNGPGIPQENLGRIFNPFFTTRPVGSGEGMGLSVADTIIRLHGGRIEVDSTPGNGTRITVWLPLERPSENAPECP